MAYPGFSIPWESWSSFSGVLVIFWFIFFPITEIFFSDFKIPKEPHNEHLTGTKVLEMLPYVFPEDRESIRKYLNRTGLPPAMEGRNKPGALRNFAEAGLKAIL